MPDPPPSPALFTRTFANAPIDRYARGQRKALTDEEKRGALLCFGEAGCVTCHAVSGDSNEMFSDFRDHVLAVPQLVPRVTNNVFDGPQANEDFGREDFSGDAGDRYAFRTSPLRNVALQAALMHDGAFTSLEAAIRHHLDVVASANSYDPAAQSLPPDRTGSSGPLEPILARLDPLLATPKLLTGTQFDDLLAFVRDGLLDPRTTPRSCASSRHTPSRAGAPRSRSSSAAKPRRTAPDALPAAQARSSYSARRD